MKFLLTKKIIIIINKIKVQERKANQEIVIKLKKKI